MTSIYIPNLLTRQTLKRKKAEHTQSYLHMNNDKEYDMKGPLLKEAWDKKKLILNGMSFPVTLTPNKDANIWCVKCQLYSCIWYYVLQPLLMNK